MNSEEVIEFWFNEIAPKQWWRKSDEFDRAVKTRFALVHRAAVRCELYTWRSNARGRLAEIIVLDQFSRNIFRDSPLSFAFDPMALCLSQEMISRGMDAELGAEEQSFCYMPFMHSESGEMHEIAVQLYTQPGLGSNLDFELRHKAIIDRFGRYPHRNETLSRPSTQEEIAFLEQPGSSF